MLARLTFDDLRVGDRFDIGHYDMTREEVMEFAGKYDPQPWHLDDEAAAANPVFGRLSASGWHTTVIFSLLADRFWKKTSVRGLAGGGMDQVRWLTPVFPGDRLTGSLEVLTIRPSASKPERGIMSMAGALHNHEGVQVMSAQLSGIFARTVAAG